MCEIESARSFRGHRLSHLGMPLRRFAKDSRFPRDCHSTGFHRRHDEPWNVGLP
jgi:hypothetical protein